MPLVSPREGVSAAARCEKVGRFKSDFVSVGWSSAPLLFLPLLVAHTRVPQPVEISSGLNGKKSHLALLKTHSFFTKGDWPSLPQARKCLLSSLHKLQFMSGWVRVRPHFYLHVVSVQTVVLRWQITASSFSQAVRHRLASALQTLVP